ncbi:MAG: amidohydrolase [Daejeonella sp.]|uniref:amidohydrolase n=1 Tax=Daejeonella sp. JGW-45 TaxID=3034148 RepID=UPI0023EB2B37|nr:amidohydrolase [Daejeonella sp. JGW-45]
MSNTIKHLLAAIIFSGSLPAFAQTVNSRVKLSLAADKIEAKVIEWRRDFHANPELGNRENRTAGIVAKHLQSLGLEVKTGVAKTGVVAILRGGKPGPVVALRADMDALPVTERGNLPFKSTVKTQYAGQEVGVMHACGHDSHTAMLMGVAEILAGMKADLKGTVKFIFQPAEEGAPAGEEGGAKLMVAEGALENPKVDVIFGLHIWAQTEVGTLTYRPGGMMAGADDIRILVKGKQAHGASPWSSVDPIVTSAQIINNLQTIVSRNLNVTENAGVLTIGSVHSGVRFNIIPEQAEMMGTIRYLSDGDYKMMEERIKTIATKTAEAAGATAEVKIPFSTHYPVTFNNLALTDKMLPSLQRTAGADNVKLIPPITGAEDFSFFQEKVPGLFFFLGGMPKGKDPKTATSHHTPDFFIDESAFKLGVKALAGLTVDYMEMQKK